MKAYSIGIKLYKKISYRRKILMFFFIISFCPLPFIANVKESKCDAGRFGVGVILGDPTGLNGKYWLSKTDGIELSVAWSLIKDRIKILGAYEKSFEIKGVKADFLENISFFPGIGGAISVGKDFGIGIIVPLGMETIFKNVPINLFLELAPGLEIIPETSFTLYGFLGVRWIFK